MNNSFEGAVEHSMDMILSLQRGQSFRSKEHIRAVKHAEWSGSYHLYKSLAA